MLVFNSTVADNLYGRRLLCVWLCRFAFARFCRFEKFFALFSVSAVSSSSDEDICLVIEILGL